MQNSYRTRYNGPQDSARSTDICNPTISHLTGEGVEERFRGHPVPGILQCGRRYCRHAVDALGDLSDALRAVVHAVRCGHVGQESLGGADVGCCLVTPGEKRGKGMDARLHYGHRKISYIETKKNLQVSLIVEYDANPIIAR